jgi:hypothetical protein
MPREKMRAGRPRSQGFGEDGTDSPGMRAGRLRSQGAGRGRLVVLSSVLMLAACRDYAITNPDLDAPLPEAVAGATLLECRVDVRAEQVTCEPHTPRLPAGMSANRIVGGQDVYVKLTSSGTSFDSGTGKLSSNVRVQNLTRHAMGTTDGTTVEGVRVFFHSGPTVTSGSGSVTVHNPDGTGLFTASNQPYFEFLTILQPMALSGASLWQFAMDPTVVTFSFLVYVSAPMTDEISALLGPVWTGNGASAEWSAADNWRDGAIPDSTSSTTVPNDVLIEGVQRPVLSGDAAVLHLRVGTGSTLDLGGNALRIYGNLDAIGAVTSGSLRLRGTDALVGGTLPSVEIESAAVLQRATVVDGSLAVTGSLATNGQVLTITGP